MAEIMRMSYECQVTNPPFSRKYEWLERAYQLEKPGKRRLLEIESEIAPIHTDSQDKIAPIQRSYL